MNRKKDLVRSLRDLGLEKMAARVDCCKRLVMGVGPNHALKPRRLGPCNTRVCRETRQRKGRNILRGFGNALGSMSAPKHVVFTQRNLAQLTKDELLIFQRQVRGLIAYMRRERGCCGGLVSYEFKYGLNGWHVHAHSILDLDFVPMDVLRRAWCFESQNRSIHIRRAWWTKDAPNPRGLKGLVQYIFKPEFEFDYGNPSLLRQFLTATWRVRLQEAFGTIRAGRDKTKRTVPPALVVSPAVVAARGFEEMIKRIEAISAKRSASDGDNS